MNKAIVIAVMLVVLRVPLFAQNGAVNEFCNLGATHATTSGMQSSNFQQGIVPQCTVTVYYTGTTKKAPIYSTLTGTATVGSVTITAGGNYSVCPTGVSFSGGGGTGAAAIVTCNGTSLRTVTVTNIGSGYTTPPTVTFTGGTGTGGAAYANLNGNLTNPFTASSNGFALFYALASQGLDVMLSGGIPPNTYSSPITMRGIYPETGDSDLPGGITEIVGPSGTVTGSVTFNGTGITQVGNTFTFNGGSSGATYLQVVTPEAYGAKCDGVTDDTAAFNNALASLTNGGELYLSACTYYLPNGLNFSLGTADFVHGWTIRGRGHGETFYKTHNANISLDLGGRDNVTIEGMTIYDDGTTANVGIARYRVANGGDGEGHFHTYRDLWMLGKYSIASLYSIASEVNNCWDCHFVNYGNGGAYVTAQTNFRGLTAAQAFMGGSNTVNNFHGGSLQGAPSTTGGAVWIADGITDNLNFYGTYIVGWAGGYSLKRGSSGTGAVQGHANFEGVRFEGTTDSVQVYANEDQYLSIHNSHFGQNPGLDINWTASGVTAGLTNASITGNSHTGQGINLKGINRTVINAHSYSGLTPTTVTVTSFIANSTLEADVESIGGSVAVYGSVVNQNDPATGTLKTLYGPNTSAAPGNSGGSVIVNKPFGQPPTSPIAGEFVTADTTRWQPGINSGTHPVFYDGTNWQDILTATSPVINGNADFRLGVGILANVISDNLYYDSPGVWRRKVTGPGVLIYTKDGDFTVFTAPTGTGGTSTAVSPKLYVSNLGVVSIPQAAAGAGNYCMQIDTTGVLSNTGAPCGTGGGGGTNVQINGGATMSSANLATNTGAGQIDVSNPAGSTVNFTLHNTTITFGSTAVSLGATTSALAANTTATTNQFFTAYDSSTGAFTKAQPSFSNLSGNLGTTQGPTSLTGILYDTTGTLSAATGAQVVTVIGTNAVTNSTNATNLLSGATGSLPYQSGPGATTFLAGNTSTTPQFLTSTGTGAAAQAPTLTGSTGSGNVVLATSPVMTTPNLGTPSTLVLTNATGLPLSGLTTQAANTVVANATAGSASPTAISLPSCSTASSALLYTTSTGFSCNTSISANTATTAGSATNFSGSLTGDVTGTQSATSVDRVKGVAMPTLTASTGLFYDNAGTVSLQATLPTAAMPSLTGAVTNTAGSLATSPGKIDVTNANGYCSDAGASDTYACSLSPAITAYTTGVHYRFKANTANTGTASINFNSVGAATIVKAVGGITTVLADNDIRAGQWVDLIYDGTNMQMQSLLGNAATGTGTVTSSGSPTIHQVAIFTTATDIKGVGVGATDKPLVGVTGADPAFSKLTLTNPATSATITIADTKTLTVNNTLTFSGTDSSTLNIGSGGTLGSAAYATAPTGSIVGTGQANTYTTGLQDFSSATMNLPGSAGYAPTTDKSIGTNTTTHALVYGSNGTTLVSAVAATGTNTATTCSNQVVTAVSGIAAPTCSTVTSSMVNNTIALTGTDINTSNQVTGLRGIALPTLAASTGILYDTSGTLSLAATLPTAAMPALTGAVTNTAGSLATSMGKVDVTDANTNCADAGASDTYACNLSPAVTAYTTGIHYRFKANTANTGAATINFNAVGAKTIVKVTGGITTALADNDIQAGQWVDLVYDGTNMQMQSTLGNAASGSGTVSGQANGVIPLATGATAITAQSHLSDNGLAVTSNLPLAVAGATHGITIPAGTAVSGLANNVIISSDATNGYLMANENNTGSSRVCTAANSASVSGCGSGSGTVTDGAGTTTAGIIPQSTTTAHLLDYSSGLSISANTLTYTGSGGFVAPKIATNGTGAGGIELTQGAAPSLGTTAVTIAAATSVTSYAVILPGLAPTSGNTYLSCAVPSAGISTCSWTSGGAGGGTVTSSGSPTIHQVAVFTTATDIKGVGVGATDKPLVGVTGADPAFSKLTLTNPATAATITIADTKTLTVNNTLTFSGTDSSTLNIGSGGTLGTAAYISSTAGGDLSGTLPSPTVAKINGVTLPTIAGVTGLLYDTAGTLSMASTLPTAAMPALTGAVTNTAGSLATSPGKIDVTNANGYCADAGASDTYTCSLSPAVTAYVTGVHYRFKANTANTGTASINFNSVGAATIVKAAGGITTTLADNDIRAGQWVDLVYDGTNMQMQSTLGNAASGSGTVTDGAGTTTAGIIPESTTSAHILDYSSGLSISANTLTYTGSGGFVAPKIATNGSGAGGIELTQGAAPSLGTTAITIAAATSVTSYAVILPGAAPTSGNTYLSCGVPSAGISACSWTAGGAGGGTVTSSGTPTIHQVAVFTAATDIKGVGVGATDKPLVGVTGADPAFSKLTLTNPATTATFTLADNKTFTVNNTLTLSGTDSSTLNIGGGGTLGTAAYISSTAGGDLSGTLPSPTVRSIHDAVTTVSSSPYTVATTDSYIACDATSGAITINLPAATGTGRNITIKKIDSTSNACTPTRAASDTIDGATSYSLTVQYAASKVLDQASGVWARTHVNQLGGDLSGVSTNATVSKINGATVPTIAATTGLMYDTAGTLSIASTLPTAAEPAHTGDVTNSAGSLALTIAGNAVTFAKMATQAADTVVMNASGSTAVPSAVAMPTSGTNGCAGVSNALTYNTTTHVWGCNTISGSGTVTVVGGGSLNANSLVTGGGTTTLQTPSSGSTLDTSGNMTLAGYVSATTSFASGTVGALNVGTSPYSDTGLGLNIWGSTNGYIIGAIGNTSTGTSASACYIVGNSTTTATTNYGEICMNGSGFTGSGPYNTANMFTVDSVSRDIWIGTATSNAIHLSANNSTTDAITISSANAVSFPGGLSVSASGAGGIEMTQGAAPSLGTTAVTIAAPTSVTSYAMILPGVAPTSGNTYLSCAVPSAGISSCSWTSAGSGSGTVNAAAQYDIPYYSTAGTSTVLSGAAISGIVKASTSGAPVAATAGTDYGYPAATAGSAGITAFNNGTATTDARSDHTHRVFQSLTWYFPGTPATGVNALILNVPEGVTNAVITDMRVSMGTGSSSGNSTYNIQRCTGSCAGSSATFANIYATGLVIGTVTTTTNRSVSCVGAGTCGSLTSTISAGDQFKANIVGLGTSVADVTITLTYKAETTN